MTKISDCDAWLFANNEWLTDPGISQVYKFRCVWQAALDTKAQQPEAVVSFLRAFQATEAHRNTCEPCIISGTCEDGAELWDRLMDAWALVDEDTLDADTKGEG